MGFTYVCLTHLHDDVFVLPCVSRCFTHVWHQMQHGVSGKCANRQSDKDVEDLVEVAALHDGNNGDTHEAGETDDGHRQKSVEPHCNK